jgi:hypothetical protein
MPHLKKVDLIEGRFSMAENTIRGTDDTRFSHAHLTYEVQI